MMTMLASVLMFAFDAPGARPWRPVDDVVMGGRSRSQFRIDSDVAVFEGALSLENNGGFASVRSPAGPWDLSACDGIEIEVRGDGNRYKLRLKNDASFDGVHYQSSFDTQRGAWTTLRLPFREFLPVFRGRRVPDAPLLARAHVAVVGLMIADQQAGPFRLEIRRISGYSGATR